LYTSLELTIQLEEVQRKLAQTQRINALLLSRSMVIIKGKFDCDTGEELHSEESKDRTTTREQDRFVSGEEKPAEEFDKSKDSSSEKNQQNIVSEKNVSAKDANGSRKGNLEENVLSDTETSAEIKNDTMNDELDNRNDSDEQIVAENTDDPTKENLQQHVKALEAERETFLKTIGSLEVKVQGLEKKVNEMEQVKEASECKIQAYEALFSTMNEQALENSGLVDECHKEDEVKPPDSIGFAFKNAKEQADLPDTIETSENTWSDCDSSISTNLHHQRLEI